MDTAIAVLVVGATVSAVALLTTNVYIQRKLEPLKRLPGEVQTLQAGDQVKDEKKGDTKSAPAYGTGSDDADQERLLKRIRDAKVSDFKQLDTDIDNWTTGYSKTKVRIEMTKRRSDELAKLAERMKTTPKTLAGLKWVWAEVAKLNIEVDAAFRIKSGKTEFANQLTRLLVAHLKTVLLDKARGSGKITLPAVTDEVNKFFKPTAKLQLKKDAITELVRVMNAKPLNENSVGENVGKVVMYSSGYRATLE
jgi:GH24 family phage-related lysozyme (muramidase)